MSADILLVEDDEDISAMLSELLRNEGFIVRQQFDGKAGEHTALNNRFDIIILDIMLPGKNGLDVLRDLRPHVPTPILMLTAKGDDVDRIIGLEMGADDYLPKPFHPRELIARINALLRRVEIDQSCSVLERYTLGPLELNTKLREAHLNGELIDLTSTEFNLLLNLLQSPNEIVSKETLTQATLGRKLSLHDRAIDMHVSNLRKKISRPTIKTIRGVGYLLQEE